MAKVTIISGFLGAGKTTFIKKLLEQVYAGQKVVLIENEFGEIGIDGGFLKDAGIQITEMNSGCICCSLVGDFGKALIKVSKEYAPDRIIIEPSGVGKLSDVVAAVERVKDEAGLELDCFLTVADATKAKMYMKNFGEFYNDQIEHAGTIVLSRTQNMDAAKLEASVALIRDKNAEAAIITTPWDELNGEQIVSALEKKSLMDELLKEALEHSAEHHHDDDDEDEDEHEHHTIITMRMVGSAAVAVDIITITTMQMMCSQAGAGRPLMYTLRKRLRTYLSSSQRSLSSVLF